MLSAMTAAWHADTSCDSPALDHAARQVTLPTSFVICPGRPIRARAAATGGWDAQGLPDGGGTDDPRHLSVSGAPGYGLIMIKRKIALPPEHLYPADEWRVVETQFPDEFADRTETVFALSNSYLRILDMRAGTLTRELTWATGAGKHVRIRSRRIVSLESRHVVAMTYEVTVLNGSAPVVISSLVLERQDAHLADGAPEYHPADPRLATMLPRRVLNVQAAELADRRILLGYQTTNSRMTLGVGVDHVIDAACSYTTTGSLDDSAREILITADARPGVPVRITKYATYQTSRSAPVAELVNRCRQTLDRAVRDGFDMLVTSQRANLDRFWDRADVRVRARLSPVRQQQAIRWNLYQVAQASWRAEGVGIPAKGLTGQAYEGHYFWDTEIYVLPFLSYTQPRIARNLLRFRHSMLDRARDRAREVTQRGALYPWRTINGEEASSNFQSGTAQYHINADIAYAIRRHANVCGDVRLLGEIGAEMLVETARLWEDLGFYGADNRFHIHGVTGPDEYTTVVNDNTYTNLMARLNLNFAAATVRRLRQERPDDYTSLVHQVRLQASELDSWERAAAAMYVPFDEERQIHPQDDTFLSREPWDLDGTPRDKFPLLLHYHPLVIYRHQVLKQADIVLAMFLLGNEFPEEQKRRNFDYYDPITTGDSSLSACVQSIIAAEIGKERQALEYFQYAVLMDLGNVAGNASDGVHIASAAGVWSALVFGFGGVRDFDGWLSFRAQPATRLERTGILAAVLRTADPRPGHPRRRALSPGKGQSARRHHPRRVTRSQPGHSRRDQASAMTCDDVQGGEVRPASPRARSRARDVSKDLVSGALRPCGYLPLRSTVGWP
jgi:alpha,alpha-trehalose phosphorylase